MLSYNGMGPPWTLFRICIYSGTSKNGHIGDRSVVLCREVVPILEVVTELQCVQKIQHFTHIATCSLDAVAVSLGL